MPIPTDGKPNRRDAISYKLITLVMSLCPPHLKRSLLKELAALPFSACVDAAVLLLTRMGYEDVTPTSRADFIGRHLDGGCDLTAVRTVSGGRRKVVIQLKRYPAERGLFRRSLDELRGVVLRAGASEGLLITTTNFSPSVPRQEYASAPVAPLRLIDGDELVNLMTLCRVGALKLPPPNERTNGSYQLDTAYFHQLVTKHRITRHSATRRVRLAGVIISVYPSARRS